MARAFPIDGSCVQRTAGLLGVLIGLVALIGPAPGEAQAKKRPTGTLTVQVDGLPGGTSAKVTVQGNGFRKKVTKPGRTILKRLRLGRYSVEAKPVSLGGNQALPVKSSLSVVISKRNPKGAVTVVYR